MDDMRSSLEGWGSGLLGVIIFSGSLPATRVAVADFSPMFLTSARAVIAALLASALLILLGQTRPERNDLLSLGIVALGVVIGFPLLTALALQHVTSAHSIVFIGLLPLATAIFGVLRGGERNGRSRCSGCFPASGARRWPLSLSSDGSRSLTADFLMIAAIILCGLGYTEGAKLSRRPGRLAGHFMGARVFSAADAGSDGDDVAGIMGRASPLRPGSASLTSRCFRCWWASSSGTGASLSAE